MRLQGRRGSTVLYLWLQNEDWSRRITNVSLLFSAEQHALLDRDGKILVAYEPRFESWFTGDRKPLRGIRVEAEDALRLWVEQEHWECIGTFKQLYFDCQQQALCNGEGIAQLFYIAAQNCWSQQGVDFSAHPFYRVCITSQEYRPRI